MNRRRTVPDRRIVLDNSVCHILWKDEAALSDVDRAHQPWAERVSNEVKATFFVPAPVLAERLYLLPAEQTSEVVARMKRADIVIAYFDDHSALHYAENDWKKVLNHGRYCAKFDHMIIATALRWKADLLTYDLDQTTRAKDVGVPVFTPQEALNPAGQSILPFPGKGRKALLS